MRNKRSAFTTVELVIIIAVIAVIAVLAMLFVPKLFFANTVQESEDTQLMRCLNAALSTDALLNGKHKTMSDAWKVAKEYGYDVSIINKSGTNPEILWDAENDVFCYFHADTNEVEYVRGSADKAKRLTAGDARLWRIYQTYEDYVAKSSDTFSAYAAKDKSWERQVSVKARGFDAGENADISVTYTGDTTARTVTVCTCGGDLSVDAPRDTVYHYGTVDCVTVERVAPASYDEYGTVTGNIFVHNGHVDLSGAVGINYVIVTGEGVNVTRGDDTIIVVTRDAKDVVINGTETDNDDRRVTKNVVYLDETLTAEQEELAKKFAGLGTEEVPFLIQSAEDYRTVAREAKDLSGYDFKQTADIALDETMTLNKKINVDLDDHTLTVKDEKQLGEDVYLDNGKTVVNGNVVIGTETETEAESESETDAESET